MQFLDAVSLFQVILVGFMVGFLILGFLIGHYESKLSESSRDVQIGAIVFVAIIIAIWFFSSVYISSSSMSIIVLLIIGEIMFVIGYALSFCIWKFRKRNGSGWMI